MSSIQEKYTRARNTSNLKSAPRTRFSSADVLGAVGMASQERDHNTAMMLWEVLFRGKTQSKMALVDVLSKDLLMMMRRNKIKGEPRRITMEVVAWYLHGTCKPCGGLGMEKMPNAPALSGRLCKACHGTKRVPLPRSEGHDWLVDRMGKLSAIAGGKVMRKIADDLADF
jgi:hypothetical protein